MRTHKLFMWTVISVFSIFALGNGYAQELLDQTQITEPVFEKVYVSPDRILIYPEGVFFLNEAGEVASARLVASDAFGLYIVTTSYQCPACRRRNRDNVCMNQKCPLYGK